MGQTFSSLPRMWQILGGNGEGGTILRSGGKHSPTRLESILLNDDIINKPVIVISVTGASRSGKSLLMGMMLRHLSKKKKGFRIPPPLDLSHTTGILMWTPPFSVTLPTGEDAVIVLMDTQGTVDDSTEYQAHAENTLSMLLSSVHICNVMDDVNDRDLERLHPFTEYGRMMLDETNTTPFQKLMFVVRDWTKTDEFQLGGKGGNRLVTKRLQTPSSKNTLADVLDDIGDCFTDINGFLMAHPGQEVACKKDFDGDSNMDPAFVASLTELMSEILAPENLVIKTIAGNPLTSRDLYTFFTKYIELFPRDEMPKPGKIMQATAEASHITARQKAKSQYEEEMNCLLRDGQPSIDPENLDKKHREAATKAEKAFSDRKKIGNEKMSQEHLKTLVKEIGEWFEAFAEQMKHKDHVTYVIRLIDACTMIYIGEMKPVVEKPGSVSQKDMNSAQHAAKDKAMTKFDVRIKNYSVGWDSRFKLARVIGTHYRLIRHHNEMKEDCENREAARACMKAVELAHKCYRTVLDGTTTDTTLTQEKLERHHQKALQGAIDTFKSLKEGEESLTTAYQDSLQKINEEYLELRTYSLPSNWS